MLTEILIIVALVLLNGLFAGAEIAVLSVRKTRLTELVDEGRAGARAVAWLRSEPERFLATVQVGITVVGTTAAALGGERLARDLARLLAPLPFVGRYAQGVALALVVGGVSYLSLILGELVPKSLALRASERYALRVARPLRALATLARPVVWLLVASSNAVLRLFGDKTSFTEARLSAEELEDLVEEAGRVGALDARTTEIASRALAFRELTVAEVMVPRGAIVALPVDAEPAQLRQAAEVRPFARLPLYEDSPDNLVGYVALKDLLGPALRGERVVLRSLMRPLHFVPETTRAGALLQELQRRRAPLAIAVDETGSVAGLITVEDLVEELVGEIASEHDPAPALVRPEPDGAAVVQGVAPIREVNRALDLDLPEGEGFSTVAGLCTHLAARIPEVGTRLTAPDGTGLEVVDATARRVRSVRVRPRRAEA